MKRHIRTWAALALVALAAGAALNAPAAARHHVPTVAAAEKPPAPRPVRCDWDSEFTQAVEDANEDPARWTVVDDLDRHAKADWGSMQVTFNRQTACPLVRGVVNHQWMYLQLARVYGADVMRHWFSETPIEVERVADCGAWLLGTDFGNHREDRDCTPTELAAAGRIIAASTRTCDPVRVREVHLTTCR